MSGISSRVELAEKPKTCPACGRGPVATILYGLPSFSSELELKMNEGAVTLGGCCISDDDPAWECTRCRLKMFRKQGP